MTDQARARFDSAEIYAIDTDAYDADVEYWASLVTARAPRRLLELSCGSARLLVPMTRAGLAVEPRLQAVGLDIAPTMISRAQQRVANEPDLRDRIELVTADMTDFDLRLPDRPERALFDLIVIPANGLAFLTETEAQLACLAAVRRHLAPGGLLAFDFIVPQVSYLAISEKGSPLRMTRDVVDPAPGIRRMLRFDSDRYDAARQVEFGTYLFELHTDAGDIMRATNDLAWKMVFPNELELMLRHAGLRVVDRFGDLERRPFDRRSGQYLWTAEAA